MSNQINSSLSAALQTYFRQLWRNTMNNQEQIMEQLRTLKSIVDSHVIFDERHDTSSFVIEEDDLILRMHRNENTNIRSVLIASIDRGSTSSIGSHINFSDDLHHIEACIRVEGTGRGSFNRKISERSLIGFVTCLVASVDEELLSHVTMAQE